MSRNVVRLSVLGEVSVRVGNHAHPINAGKLRHLLALLVANANQVTSVNDITSEIWKTAAPSRAVLGSVQTSIYNLRRKLASIDTGPGALTVITRAGGYQLVVDPNAVDALEFERNIVEGSRLLDSDPSGAACILDRAEALWRRPVFGGVPYGEVLRTHTARLDELHRWARELRIEARMRMAPDPALVDDLRRAIAEDRYNENLYGYLICTLADSGRICEARVIYRQMCEVLHAELGIDPSERSREIYARISGIGLVSHFL